MMLITNTNLILVTLLSSSTLLLQHVSCQKQQQQTDAGGGGTSQPLPALHNVNSSSNNSSSPGSSIPIIEAQSVKLNSPSATIKNVSELPGKTSQPLPSSSQVNSKRFGDLPRLSSFLWKKNVAPASAEYPKFGFPSNVDQQSAGSVMQLSAASLPGRTLSWNDQSSSSPPLSSRLRGILPSLRLKDVLGKGNNNHQQQQNFHQSMLQLTPSESSQSVISSMDAATAAQISSSLGSSSPPPSSMNGGGVSSSDLGLSAAVSPSQLSQLLASNGLLMNQPGGTSAAASSSSSMTGSSSSSLTPDQVSKLTASFEHGFNQQVQQQLYQMNQQQQQQTSADVSSGVGGVSGGGTTSIFRKLVSSGRRRIPSFSLLRPSASSTSSLPGIMNMNNPLIPSPSNTNIGSVGALLNNANNEKHNLMNNNNHISLHKLIPFLWPYKLSPPIPGAPIPAPPTTTTSKLRELFKPKFFKSLDQQPQQQQQAPFIDQQAVDQQQIPAFLAHPDLTKNHHQHHNSDVGGSFFSTVTKSLTEANSPSNGNSDHHQTSSSNIQYKPHLHFIEGHEQPEKDDDDQYPKDNEPILPSQPEESSVSMVNAGGDDEKQKDSKLQLDAVRAITSLLKGQQKKNQKQKNILQFRLPEEAEGSEVPKTYDEYLRQQQKQQELVEAAKVEALEAAKNYAMKSGQSKIAIKPVKLIQMVLGNNQQNKDQEDEQQQQQLNVGQQYLQQTVNDISAASSAVGSTEESRNMPIYTANQQIAHPQLPRRIRRPIRPQQVPQYQQQPNGDILEVAPSSNGASQNSEFQFVRLPVQETPSEHHHGHEEYGQPSVAMSEENQSELMQQFAQGLSPQQQMLLSALESAPRPPLPPHVSLAPEVTFIQRPSATVAFFPPTINHRPGYHGLDTSSSAHQGSHVDPNLGQYEFVGQPHAQQIPVHLLMQQFGQQVPPHLLHHQHITHQLHPQHHPSVGGRVVKTVVIKEQLEHIAPGHQPQPQQQQQQHHHQHGQQLAPPLQPVQPPRGPITGYGMNGWIPKDVPNDWTPAVHYRSASHSYNDEIKFNSFDRMIPTTRSPADVVQINHHWFPSTDKTIHGLTSTPVTERPSVAKPTDAEPPTSAIAHEESKDERDRPQYEEAVIEELEDIHKVSSTEATAAPVVTSTKPVTIVTVSNDKYIKPRTVYRPKPVVRVAPSTTTSTTTTTTEFPAYREDDVHVGIVDSQEPKVEHSEPLNESSSAGATIEVIPSTKRHLFERISQTTPVFGMPSTTSTSTTTTTTTTPRPSPITTVATAANVVVESGSVKKDKISRRNSSVPSIVLSSIDIELGPKGGRRSAAVASAASSFLANLDKKVGLIKDNITWEQ